MPKKAKCQCGNVFEAEGDPPAGQLFPCPACGQPAPVMPARGKGMAIASLVLGIVGLLAWCLPLCGAPVTICGIIFGILGLKSDGRKMAIAGIILAVIGLVATIINGAIGIYLAATGQHSVVNWLEGLAE
jgi:uncharacterized membrane protein